jgi:hypothetical protein
MVLKLFLFILLFAKTTDADSRADSKTATMSFRILKKYNFKMEEVSWFPSMVHENKNTVTYGCLDSLHILPTLTENEDWNPATYNAFIEWLRSTDSIIVAKTANSTTLEYVGRQLYYWRKGNFYCGLKTTRNCNDEMFRSLCIIKWFL